MDIGVLPPKPIIRNVYSRRNRKMDRSWMYDRFNPHRRGLKYEFISGVQEFIKKAKEQPCFLSERKIKCPCESCKCLKSFTPRDVEGHLYKSGFNPNYSIWTEHGELEQNICLMNQSNSSERMEKEEVVVEEEDPKTPHMKESEEEDPETLHIEESEVEENHITLQEIDSNEQNADGKVLIRPCGRGWAPSSAPAAAIKHAIQSHFQGPFHRWKETPEDVREYWWKLFGDMIAWDPRDHRYIKKTFQTRGAKRLSGMLSKVRKKGIRPHWICEEAWKGLITHWEGEAFIQVSTQNKTNRASGKAAVHTTGRKAHVDVALSMAHELGCSVDPAELFMATHKNKSGNWVDNRSQATYEHYHDRLKEVQKQIGEASQNGEQVVDEATKLELWKEVAGGKTRGSYGTADFASNLGCGVTSLTQESREPYSGRCDHAMHIEAIDAARQEAATALQEAAAARQEAADAKQRYQLLEEQFLKVVKSMKALERQSASASTSASLAHRGLPNNDGDHLPDEVMPDCRRKKRQAISRHSHYDDDHSLDEILLYRRRKQHQAQRGRPYYDDDNSLDVVVRKQHQAKRGRPHYNDGDLLDEAVRKQHQANRGPPHYDDDTLLDEVLPKQRQAKRGRPQYDDDNSLDEVLPKRHQAKRGHPYCEDDLLDDVLPKQCQAKRGRHQYDDDNSLDEILPKHRRAKRGHPYYEDDLLDDVLPKQCQAKRGRHQHDDDNSLDEILPKHRRAKRGHPYYEDDLLDDVLPKQCQAKRGRPRYEDDHSLDEVLPKQHQAKKGLPHHEDDHSLDEVLPKQHKVKRGHPHYDEDDLLDMGHPHYADDDLQDEVVPKQYRAPKRHPQYDDDDLLDRGHPHYYDDDSPYEVVPKQNRTPRGHPHYDDNILLYEAASKQRQAKRGHLHYDDVSPEEVFPKQRQAKRGHPHYDDDSLDEVLPKQHQAKRGHPYHDDDSPASRRHRYRH
ncbi:unnamed protein product [Lathyrus oleraceus]